MSRRFGRLILRTVLAPIHGVQLLSGAKSFMDNSLIGSRFLNERGLHAWRVWAADRLACRRRARLAHLIDPADREAFDRDGFIVKPQFLSAEHFASLLTEVRAYRGEVREQVQGNAITRRIACDQRVLAAIPALRALQRMASWQGLIRYAGSFDVEPLLYIQAVQSHAQPCASDPQESLHADTFHSTVKSWLFLGDVEPGAMCFSYVPGSHRLTPERLRWERSRSIALSSGGDYLSRRGSMRVGPDDLEALGLPAARLFAVPANTLIVADTHGFHARGPSTQPTLRAEIWAYHRRNPFFPLPGLDLWRPSVLHDRRIGAFWRGGDLLERLGLQRQVWRRRSGVGAFDAFGTARTLSPVPQASDAQPMRAR